MNISLRTEPVQMLKSGVLDFKILPTCKIIAAGLKQKSKEFINV